MSEQPAALLRKATSKEWEPLDRGGAQTGLTEPLLAHNLVVLAGLGTSRCVAGPSMEDLWSLVADHDDLEAVLEATGSKRFAKSQDMESLLSRLHLQLEVKPDDKTRDFVTHAEKQIATACDFVTESTSLDTHTLFLQKIARRPRDRARTRIFTTNYDLVFEEAAARSAFVVIDGFAFGSSRTFDPNYFDYDIVRLVPPANRQDLVPNVFVLHKLHGSINWESDGTRIHSRVGRAKKPEMIFPRSSKFELSFRQPFFDSASRFHTVLRQPGTTLLIVGSGLRDPHIAGPILSSVRANGQLNVIVVSSALQQECADDGLPHKVLLELQQSGDERVTLIEADFARLTELLPDLSPPGDADKFRSLIERFPEDRWHSPTTRSTQND